MLAISNAFFLGDMRKLGSYGFHYHLLETFSQTIKYYIYFHMEKHLFSLKLALFYDVILLPQNLSKN